MPWKKVEEEDVWNYKRIIRNGNDKKPEKRLEIGMKIKSGQKIQHD